MMLVRFIRFVVRFRIWASGGKSDNRMALSRSDYPIYGFPPRTPLPQALRPARTVALNRMSDLNDEDDFLSFLGAPPQTPETAA